MKCRGGSGENFTEGKFIYGRERKNLSNVFTRLLYKSRPCSCRRHPRLRLSRMSFIRTSSCSFAAELRVARSPLQERFVELISGWVIRWMVGDDGLNDEMRGGSAREKQFQRLKLAYPIKILIETHRFALNIRLKVGRRWKSIDLARMRNWHGVTGCAENHIRWIDLLRDGGWSATCEIDLREEHEF